MRILLTAGFFIVTHCCFASFTSSLKSPQDSTVLSEKQFLEEYGKDDSSRALIKFYFSRRKRGNNFLSVGIATAFSGGIALLKTNALIHEQRSSHESQGFLDGAVYGILIEYCLLILGTGLGFVVIGTTLKSKYSPRQLFLKLQEYFSGRYIPKGIAKNKQFRAYVQYGDWNHKTKRRLKVYDKETRRAKRMKLAIS